MLEFQELTVKEGARLRPYYETCDYRLCEYSLGVKLMWRDYLHPWFTEAAGCLIIRNCIEGQYVFDYPILGPEGDAGAALAAIEQYCGDKELPLVLSVVPEDKASQLVLRYPRVTSGKFEFTVGGKTQVVSAGDGIYIEPDVLHGCKCLEAGLLIDCFSPMRADFLKK